MQLSNVSRERSASNCLTLKNTAQKSFEILSSIYKKHSGTVLELGNGVVYVKCTPMQFLTSEIIILHYSRKENEVGACNEVGVWPSVRLNLLSPMQL